MAVIRIAALCLLLTGCALSDADRWQIGDVASTGVGIGAADLIEANPLGLPVILPAKLAIQVGSRYANPYTCYQLQVAQSGAGRIATLWNVGMIAAPGGIAIAAVGAMVGFGYAAAKADDIKMSAVRTCYGETVPRCYTPPEGYEIHDEDWWLAIHPPIKPNSHEWRDGIYCVEMTHPDTEYVRGVVEGQGWGLSRGAK